jgi:hypothetical protein
MRTRIVNSAGLSPVSALKIRWKWNGENPTLEARSPKRRLELRSDMIASIAQLTAFR